MPKINGLGHISIRLWGMKKKNVSIFVINLIKYKKKIDINMIRY